MEKVNRDQLFTASNNTKFHIKYELKVAAVRFEIKKLM